MLKRFALLIVLSATLILRSFAGAYVDSYRPPAEVAAPTPEEFKAATTPYNPPVPPAPIEKVIPAPLIKHYGLTAGIAGDYVTLGYSREDLFVEAGYLNNQGDQSLLVKAGGTLAQIDKSILRTGLTLNPGLSSLPSLGLFLGIETFISERISLAGDAFVWSGNDRSILPIAQWSAKIVL